VSLNPLLAIKALAAYQFGIEVAEALFKKEIMNSLKPKFSGKTGRIRYIFLNNAPYLSIRTSDGFLTLSIKAAREVLSSLSKFENLVVVDKNAVKSMLERKEVLAKQVKEVSKNLKAGSEVIVIDEDRKIIAVGRAILSGREMLEIKRGAVIKLRKVSRYV